MILHDKRAILMAEDMPQIPEEKTFQVWVIEDEVPKPSGLFEPKEDPVAIVVENSVYRADAIAVTVERNGGVRKPTTDPMLMAKL